MLSCTPASGLAPVPSASPAAATRWAPRGPFCSSGRELQVVLLIFTGRFQIRGKGVEGRNRLGREEG